MKNNLPVQEKTLKHTEHLQFQYKKKLQELIKKEKKLPKIFPTHYNFLIAQDLWQAHYQILGKIFLKELITLNINMDTIIKNVKLVELNINIATVFLNNQTLKMI